VRQSTIITLGASVAFGVFAVILARGWINDAIREEYSRQVVPVSQPVSVTKDMDLVSVVVVNTDLNFGDVLHPDMLRMVEYPSDAIPVGAYETTNNIFTDPTQATIVLRRMARNEAVLDYKISGPGARGSLSALIGDGMRAVSVRVTDVSGVSGFVMPGDFIDVIYTRDEQAKRNEDNLQSDILLQNVKVLGVDQDLSSELEEPSLVKTVTLEVSNLDAQKLHLAQDAGKLSLTLRKAGDTSTDTTTTVYQKSILASKQQAPVRYVRRQKTSPKPAVKSDSGLANVTIIRGEERNDVQVIKDRTLEEKGAALAGG